MRILSYLNFEECFAYMELICLGNSVDKPVSPILAKLQIVIKDLLASLNISRLKYLSSFCFKSTHTSESVIFV